MLTAVEAQMDGMMKSMSQQVTKGAPVTPEQQKVQDAFREKIIAIYKQEMTWEKLEPMFIQIYSDTLSQDDVDGMIAFFQSTSGQSYVRKMPAIMQQTMGAMQKLMGPMMVKLQQAGKEMAEEMKKLETTK